MRRAGREWRAGAGLGMIVLMALAGCGGQAAPATMRFHSRPDLAPPVFTVTKRSANAAPGYIFIAPKMNAREKGPEIVDDSGQPIWFDPVPGQATDFRVQTYRGKPVLTWWVGPPTAPVLGTGMGHDVIMDSSYHVIATVQAGFGPDTADLHEFQLTPQGTALLTAYRVVPHDFSSVGGPANGRVADSIVQEVDVATGRVLFTWHSIDHVPVSESYIPPPVKGSKDSTAVDDYFHVNSIDKEPDGNLLISARNTRAVYEVDHSSGAVLWRLGGRKSSFRMEPGTTFAWQHDARRQPDGTITIFDDGAAPAVEKQSRVIRLRLDMQHMTATLVHADVSPAGVLATSQGDVQALPDGHMLVGWGSVPRVTEFAPDGSVVFDATFSAGDDSYRAFRFEWSGTPTTRPAIDVAKGGGDAVTVYASWNGATAVAGWRVLAGLDADNLAAVGGVQRKTGFETTLQATTEAPFLAVEALDSAGRVLATSAAVRRGGLAIG